MYDCIRTLLAKSKSAIDIHQSRPAVAVQEIDCGTGRPKSKYCVCKLVGFSAIFLGASVSSAVLLWLLLSHQPLRETSTQPNTTMTSNGHRQPVLFLSHGGGPSFFMEADSSGFLKGMDKGSLAEKYLKEIAKKENLTGFKAILVVSAHWEEKTITVQTTASPDLYYDYYGFPPETYNLNWKAEGSAALAQRTKKLLESKGITCATNDKRGYDHGVFVPLLLAFPKPSVPVFQLSLDSSLSTEKHLALGEALAPLRDEGVLIIGSGFTTHRMGPSVPGYGQKFQTWLHKLLTDPSLTPSERRECLASCNKDSRVKDAHPRIEHFLPFLVTTAASGYTPGKVIFSQPLMDKEALLEHYFWQ